MRCRNRRTVGRVSLPVPLTAALVQLGVEAVRHVGMPLLRLVGSFLASFTVDATRSDDGGPSPADQLVQTALRVVKNIDHTGKSGEEKRRSAQSVMARWNEDHGRRFRSKQINAAIELAVLALDGMPDWDEA